MVEGFLGSIAAHLGEGLPDGQAKPLEAPIACTSFCRIASSNNCWTTRRGRLIRLARSRTVSQPSTLMNFNNKHSCAAGYRSPTPRSARLARRGALMKVAPLSNTRGRSGLHPGARHPSFAARAPQRSHQGLQFSRLTSISPKRIANTISIAWSDLRERRLSGY